MAGKLNKKQKKQIETNRKKIQNLQQLLAAAKKQPDDPEEPVRLQAEIDKLKQQIEDIQAS